jgi:hypothetical protein
MASHALRASTWTWLARSPLGSAARVAAGLILGSFVAYLVSGGSILTVSVDQLSTWVGAALVVATPIVIAWVNPADTRYGRQAPPPPE